MITDCQWRIGGNLIACKEKGGFTLIELTDQRLDTAPRDYHTKDNVPVQVDAVIFWRITNPRDAVYAVDHLIESLIDLSLNTLRNRIGEISLDELLSGQQILLEKIQTDVAVTAQRWGVVVQRVEIQELNVDEATRDAMRAEMTAERQRRAELLRAEGEARAKEISAEAEAKALLTKAEAQKKEQILIAEGQAEAKNKLAIADAAYIEKIALATKASPADLMKFVLAQKCVEGFEAITQNPSNKVFLPNSTHGFNLLLDEQ